MSFGLSFWLSLLAVAGLILLAYIGVGAAHLNYLFGVIIPYSYNGRSAEIAPLDKAK